MPHLVARIAMFISVALLVGVPALAVAYGGASVQGYAADTAIDKGAIVELTGENANRVKVASQGASQNMFGVTVDRNQLPVTLSGGLENETFVAVSGTYDVLVSTQGGAIASGDYITLSSLDGVGMKAGTKEKTVLGRANAAFDGKGIALGKATLKDTAGNTTGTVTLGLVPVTVDIKSNPNTISTKANVPEPLQRVGQAIAEKEVSAIRIYISLAISIISVLASVIIVYSGVRNGVISIGRNPMSKKSIFRALLETILTSLLILIIGAFAVYLLLKL